MRISNLVVLSRLEHGTRSYSRHPPFIQSQRQAPQPKKKGNEKEEKNLTRLFWEPWAK